MFLLSSDTSRYFNLLFWGRKLYPLGVLEVGSRVVETFFSLSLFFLLLQHQRSAVYHDKDIFSHLDMQDNQLFQL